jgi:hypothetical protein
MAADDNKPLPPESQIKMLKAEREIQAEQAKMTELQKEFDTSKKILKDLRTYMENECSAAAKKENVVLAKQASLDVGSIVSG